MSEHYDWESWCDFFLEAVEQKAIGNLTIAENIRTLISGEYNGNYDNAVFKPCLTCTVS
ncbi:MAG: hypothetical protein IT392_01100 [Nitrospirae bacterium]|nr:hypothetical protein [Nitrospirota bacterium]